MGLDFSCFFGHQGVTDKSMKLFCLFWSKKRLGKQFGRVNSVTENVRTFMDLDLTDLCGPSFVIL